MIIKIDESDQLFVDLDKTCQHIQVAYDTHKNDKNVIELGDGKQIDLSKGSTGRLLIKGIITPIIVPMMDFLFRSLGSELPKYKRGDDLFDYVISNVLYLIGTHGNRITLYVYTKDDIYSGKTIQSVSTTKRRETNSSLLQSGSTEGEI